MRFATHFDRGLFRGMFIFISCIYYIHTHTYHIYSVYIYIHAYIHIDMNFSLDVHIHPETVVLGMFFGGPHDNFLSRGMLGNLGYFVEKCH